MTGRLLALDLVTALLTAGLWIAAAEGALAGRRRGAASLLAAALLVTVARVGVVGLLAGAGWTFVQEKVLLGLPLLVLPAVAAAVFAVRGRRGTATERGARSGVAATAAAAGGAVAGVLATVAFGYPVTPAAAVVCVLLTVLPAVLVLLPGRVARRATAVAAAAVLLATAVAWWGSRLPERLDLAAHSVDLGGGSATAHHHHGGLSVGDLREPAPAPSEPVRQVTLSARQATVPLAGGRRVAAWTFDGQVPGPELRLRQGELVEVTLRNVDLPDGVTLHWHGYPVPNGDDGVAGVTQDAVLPGGEFTYRFRATHTGTYWYHSHQRSAEGVRLGLYGMLVVEPRSAESTALDVAVPVHTLGGVLLTGGVDGLDRRAVAAGSEVRLRLVNTDDDPHVFAVRGTSFRLDAVDGHPVEGGRPLAGDRLPLAAGGRFDLTLRMPDGPVQLVPDGLDDRGLLLSATGSGDGPPGPDDGPLLDVSRYGAPEPMPQRFDRDFTLVLDRAVRFVDGRPRYAYTVGGRVFPDIPSLLVRPGEVVRLTVINRQSEPHPMHPHGHAVQILSRNGREATGAVWTDSFQVDAGEVWQVALTADNPGIWMLHCHNLEHAADGMSLHLMYEGVTTPFAVGSGSHNHPE